MYASLTPCLKTTVVIVRAMTNLFCAFTIKCSGATMLARLRDGTAKESCYFGQNINQEHRSLCLLNPLCSRPILLNDLSWETSIRRWKNEEEDKRCVAGWWRHASLSGVCWSLQHMTLSSAADTKDNTDIYWEYLIVGNYNLISASSPDVALLPAPEQVDSLPLVTDSSSPPIGSSRWSEKRVNMSTVCTCFFDSVGVENI